MLQKIKSLYPYNTAGAGIFSIPRILICVMRNMPEVIQLTTLNFLTYMTGYVMSIPIN
jgi:hypothetical protein